MFKNLLIVTTFFSINVYATTQEAIQEKAAFICSQIMTNPSFKYEDYFSQNFINKIKYDDLVQILSGVAQDDGNCSKYTLAVVNGNRSKVRFYTNTTSQKFSMSLDENNLIAGLQYQGRSDSKISFSSNQDLYSGFNKLNGIKSITLKELNSNNSILDLNSKDPVALGSEFKLYVLKTLSEKIMGQKANWEDKLKLQEDLKSLPSGVMQDYPANQEFRLLDFAGLMISRSDNTATDHLIEFLGRDSILSSMVGYNSFLGRNAPFLSTMDLFRLRALNEDSLNNYLSLSSTDKTNFLGDLKKKYDRNSLIEALKDWDGPRDILKAEWFASTSDICSTVESLQKYSDIDPKILQILSISVPFVWTEDDPNFEYVGYKGGSEPGVLTMTFLLKTRNQKWACLSMAVNNEKENLNEDSVFDLYQATLTYAGNILNSKGVVQTNH